MNKKGIISTIGTNTARVIFPDLDNTISYELETSKNIELINLTPGENVLVCFYNQDLNSGIIVAELR